MFVQWEAMKFHAFANHRHITPVIRYQTSYNFIKLRIQPGHEFCKLGSFLPIPYHLFVHGGVEKVLR